MAELQSEALLEVDGLTVCYRSSNQRQPVLEGVSFHIAPAEVVGMLGESGGGKTTVALAALRLLPPGACIEWGSIRFRGHDLARLGESEMAKIRGAEISMMFQEPELALNPVMRVVDQVAEVLAAHHSGVRRLRGMAMQVLAQTGLEGERLAFAYPHELSGGQRRRVLLAQALACRPLLLIADEPTASLDSTSQLEWLALIRQLRVQLGLAMLIITHDPAILAGLADRVLVLHGGRIVEQAPLRDIIQRPVHPYTRALVASLPPVPGASGTGGKRLAVPM